MASHLFSALRVVIVGAANFWAHKAAAQTGWAGKMNGVSVVMPARNASHTIGEAVRSVLAQPMVAELLVVDDHSTDRTVAAAQEAGDGRLRVVPSPGTGIAAALNHGFNHATGDYVARCDADDLYPEMRFEWQIFWLRSHADYVAVSGGFRAIAEHGKEVADLACEGEGRDATSDLLRGHTVTHFCTWLTRSESIRRIGGARPWFETAEDIDLQLRLARCGKIWHEPKITYLYRIHDMSVTHQQTNQLREFYELEARRFARQRAQRGYDDLDAGAPPPVPLADNAIRKSGADHSIALLVGAAWNEHRQGNRIAGMRKMFGAIGRSPLDWRLWKGLGMLIIKIPG